MPVAARSRLHVTRENHSTTGIVLGKQTNRCSLKPDIQLLTPDHLQELNELLSVFEEVFEMDHVVRPDPTHLQNLLNKETFLAIIATVDGKVVGGMTVYILDQIYSEKPLAYLYDLAVLAFYQRKGIGRNLIEFITGYCRESGFEGIFVQADKADDYAIDFYRSTQPANEEQVVHFYYPLK